LDISTPQFNSLKAVLKANEINYHNSQVQFENRVITFSNLLEVKTRLYNAQSDFIQVKYQMIANELILGFYLGQTSSFRNLQYSIYTIKSFF